MRFFSFFIANTKGRHALNLFVIKPPRPTKIKFLNYYSLVNNVINAPDRF
ncbi:hypothetical protein [Moraxella lacunata]